MKLSEIGPLTEGISWKHDQGASKLAAEVMGHNSELKDSERPAKIFGDVFKAKQKKQSISGQIGFNQLFLYPLKGSKYKVLIETILYYTKGSQSTSSILLQGIYDSKSRKFSKMQAKYTLGDFDRKQKDIKMPSGSMDAKTMAEKLHKVMAPIIEQEIKSYYDGYKDYVAKGGRGMMPGSVKRAY